jgi:hypothetical protein
MKRDLLEVWYRRAEACHKSHFLASHRYARYNYLIGVPTIALTAIVGTSVFASLSTTTKQVAATVAIGAISMTAALLSSLQTFLGFAERADRHRDAGVKYGVIGRLMELILDENALPDDTAAKSLKKELDDLAASSPKIPLDILKSFGTLYTDATLDYDTSKRVSDA